MNALMRLFGSGLIGEFTGPLLAAWQAKLDAENDEQRLAAEHDIHRIEAARDIAVIEAHRKWSATSIGRWLIVVPFGLWWAAIYMVQIVNGLLGTNWVIIDVPDRIHEMALILVPAIVLADAGALVTGYLRRNR